MDLSVLVKQDDSKSGEELRLEGEKKLAKILGVETSFMKQILFWKKRSKLFRIGEFAVILQELGVSEDKEKCIEYAREIISSERIAEDYIFRKYVNGLGFTKYRLEYYPIEES